MVFCGLKVSFRIKETARKAHLKKKKGERVESIGDDLQAGIIFGVGSFGRTGLFSLS